MAKITIGPIKEDSLIFRRGRVRFSPSAMRATVEARVASEDKAPATIPEKAQEDGEDE